MMQDEANAKLERRAQYAIEKMPDLIDRIRIRRKPSDFSACYSSLATDHRVLAMYAKYIQRDDEGFRQHLRIACKLQIESIQLNDLHRLDTGNELLYALLSDDPKIIEEMARLEPPHYAQHRHNPLNNQFIVHMRQLAILGDYEALEIKVDKYAKNGRKPLRQQCAEKNDFFFLLMRADRDGLQTRISEDAKLRNDDPITADFFAFQATFEAKLCWRKGIEVHIDTPRVPMDLMPVRPLAQYDDMYDFLRPGWVPPKQGLLDRIAHLFRRH